MKKFIVKLILISFFALIVFRFTVVSLINNYENKLFEIISSSNIQEFKIELFNNLKELNKKDQILYSEDAKVLGKFINKVLKELNSNLPNN